MFSSIPCLKRASISWKSRSSSPVGSSSATFMRVSRTGRSSSRIIALRSTKSPASTASSRTVIFASRAAVFPSVSRTFAFGLGGGSGGGVATGASIASAALARSLAGSCSATRLYTARALSGRSLRNSVSASSTYASISLALSPDLNANSTCFCRCRTLLGSSRRISSTKSCACGRFPRVSKPVVARSSSSTPRSRSPASISGDPSLELLDRRFRRRRVDVGEHERSGLVALRDHAVQAQVDRPRATSASAAHARPQIVDRLWLIVDVVLPVRRAGVEVRLELERGHFHQGLARWWGRSLRDDRFDLRRLGRLRSRPPPRPPRKPGRCPDRGPLRHNGRHPRRCFRLGRLDLDLRFQERLE